MLKRKNVFLKIKKNIHIACTYIILTWKIIFLNIILKMLIWVETDFYTLFRNGNLGIGS